MSGLNRPALRYYGGKWRLADWIIRHLPPHECYVEPFAGAASVLLRKPPSPLEVYNDLDGEVVNFFQVLRDHPAALVRAITLTPYARAELDLTYEPCSDPLERARRMFVRSWQGRGGARSKWRTGWRYQRANSQRSSLVADWLENPRLVAHAERLRRVQIECSPATDVLARFDTPETLFYCDPPYVHSTRSERWHRTGYAFEMTDADHRALAEVLRSVRGMVVISGYPSPLYDEELFADWHRVTKTALTEGANRTNKPLACEVLWISPSATARGRQLSLEALS